MILAIDTTQSRASAALVGPDGRTAAEATADLSGADSLFALVSGVLGGGRIRPVAVAVCDGPGSLTGRRIGVAAATGIAKGYGVPVARISVFECLARIGGGPFAAGLGAGKAEVREFAAAPGRTVSVTDLGSLILASDNEWIVTSDLLMALGPLEKGGMRCPEVSVAVLVGLAAAKGEEAL